MLQASANYFILCNKAESVKQKVFNIVGVVIFLLFYNYFFLSNFDHLFRLGELTGGSDGPPIPVPLTIFEKIWRIVIIAPVWETIVWVYPVSKIAQHFGERTLLFPLMIISSALFGWGHNGAEGIFLQGVSGFLFFCLYIKNNYSLISAIVAHGLFNFLVIFAF